MSSSDFARQMEELDRGGTAPDLGYGSGIQTLLLAEHGLETVGGLLEVIELRTCRLHRPQGFEREPLFWSALLERR